MSDKKIMLHSKDLGNGRYEVCGVIFYAESHIEAIRKYTKRKKGIMVKKIVPEIRVMEVDGVFYPQWGNGEYWYRFYEPVPAPWYSRHYTMGEREVGFDTIEKAEEYAKRWQNKNTKIIHQV